MTRKLILTLLMGLTSIQVAWSAYPECGDQKGSNGSQGAPCRMFESSILNCGGGVYVCGNRDGCPVTQESNILGGTYNSEGNPLGFKKVELEVDVCSGVESKTAIQIKVRK